MEHYEIIVVGGGPAGSSCAGELVQAGRSVAILDRADFPRHKLCAGWIPPSLFRRLGARPDDYPGGLREYRRLNFRIKGVPLPVPTRQYAIRRYEFDFWLLQCSGAPFYHHHVHKIERIDGPAEARFCIDNRFTCRYLVGAGGTGCPVAAWQRAAGGLQRSRADLIVTLESEFIPSARRDSCYLRFFDRGLVGYSWYFPKDDGYLTIGIGGKQTELRRRGQTIREHWQPFVQHLRRKGLLEGALPDPRGHSYYLRSSDREVQECRAAPEDHVYLIGDAAGFATLDMGEGIEPAVHSGQLAARAVIEDRPLRVEAVKRRSLPDILRPGAPAQACPKTKSTPIRSEQW
jgi:menaquinone-9 beta-reductase